MFLNEKLINSRAQNKIQNHGLFPLFMIKSYQCFDLVLKQHRIALHYHLNCTQSITANVENKYDFHQYSILPETIFGEIPGRR